MLEFNQRGEEARGRSGSTCVGWLPLRRGVAARTTCRAMPSTICASEPSVSVDVHRAEQSEERSTAVGDLFSSLARFYRRKKPYLNAPSLFPSPTRPTGGYLSNLLFFNQPQRDEEKVRNVCARFLSWSRFIFGTQEALCERRCSISSGGDDVNERIASLINSGEGEVTWLSGTCPCCSRRRRRYLRERRMRA